jgi:dephospho-CoA kinase
VSAELTRLLLDAGPALLLVMAFLETCFITGLVVPAGVALLIASFLASTGQMHLPTVIVFAVAGAAAGDSVGFWVGRRSGRVFPEAGGLLGRMLGRRRAVAEDLLGRHPLYSVSLARVIAFVRTVMPLGAGSSRIAYPRFLAFDALGIVGWAVTYVSVGYLAGESWQRVGGLVGTGWALVFVVVGAAGLLAARRRSGRESFVDGPLTVGLTGNVASGKSTVAELWRKRGVPVVSADDLAREAVEPGTSGLAAVVERFGPAVLRDDGTLDRARLRDRVFADSEARADLESILHPRIQALRDAWVARQRACGARLIVAEIPLLFEAGLEGEVDRIVLVHAAESVRGRRLEERRGLGPEAARRIMSAQMPSEDKKARSHFVIENETDLDALRRRADAVLEELQRLAASPRA